MTGNDVIFKVYAVIYVILCKAEKHVPYGKLVGTRECICYSQGVTQTEVVITKFNCSSAIQLI
jgi:hypothetical protein